MKGTALSKLDAALGPYRGFLPEQFYAAQLRRGRRSSGQSMKLLHVAAGTSQFVERREGSVRRKIESG